MSGLHKVERVQRKLTKRLLGCNKLSYADRLARLKLASLEVRRLRHDLILTYKILFWLTDMNQSDFSYLLTEPTVQEVMHTNSSLATAE